jgi:tRNA(adenine34) deaminase
MSSSEDPVMFPSEDRVMSSSEDRVMSSSEDLVADDALSDEEAMAHALVQAREAAAAGEVPVGAVALRNGRIVAARHNEREATGDPTAHAEMLAMRDAAADVGGWRLSGVTLVVTLEPCPMCAGALLAGRVDRLVFGTSDPRAGCCGSLYNLCVDPRFNHELAVRSGVRAAECAEALTSFFSAKRAERDATPPPAPPFGTGPSD